MAALPAELYIPKATPLEPIVAKHSWIKIRVEHDGKPYDVPKHMSFSRLAWNSLPGMVNPADQQVWPNAGYVEVKSPGYTPPEALTTKATEPEPAASVKPTDEVNVEAVIARLKAGEKPTKGEIWAVAKHLNIEAYTTKSMPVLIETIIKAVG